MNEEMQKSIENQKKLHIGIKALIEEVYNEPVNFIMILPSSNVMATTIPPDDVAIILNSVVGSILTMNVRATVEEQENGEFKTMGMN